MALGKGDIRGNIVRQLKISERECLHILTITDSIYIYDEKSATLNRILEVLGNVENKDEFVSDDLDYKLESSMGEDYSKYINFITEEFDFLNSQGTVQEQIDFLSEKLEKSQSASNRFAHQYNEFVVRRYFIRDIEQAVEKGQITLNEMRRFDKIAELIGLNQDEIDGEYTKRFKDCYIKLVEKVYNASLSKAQEDFERGVLTGKRIKELEGFVNRGVIGNFGVNSTFIEKIANIINPVRNKEVSSLLCTLISEGREGEASEYKVVTLKAGEEEICAYQKAGKLTEINYENVIRKQGKTELNKKIEFNYTVKEEEDGKKVIAEFVKLRDEALAKDPNADIRVIERIIAIYSEEGSRYYYIQGDDIVPAIIDEEQTVEVNVAREKETLPEVQKDGIFARMQRAIRQKIYGLLKKPEESESVTSNTRLRQNVFKKYIGDMSNYAETKPSLQVSGHDKVPRKGIEEHDEL